MLGFAEVSGFFFYGTSKLRSCCTPLICTRCCTVVGSSNWGKSGCVSAFCGECLPKQTHSGVYPPNAACGLVFKARAAAQIHWSQRYVSPCKSARRFFTSLSMAFSTFPWLWGWSAELRVDFIPVISLCCVIASLTSAAALSFFMMVGLPKKFDQVSRQSITNSEVTFFAGKGTQNLLNSSMTTRADRFPRRVDEVKFPYGPA